MTESTKSFSKKQEKLVASELGGYPVGLSGAGPANPGDVKTYDWLVECKTHTKPDHSILFDIDVWKKIENEAIGIHRKPVLIVDDGSQSISRTWCLCRADNVNLNGYISTDFPAAIRKNITCKHEKLAEAIKKASKGLVMENSFYQGVVFEIEWANETVIVLPFKIFKEIFEK